MNPAQPRYSQHHYSQAREQTPFRAAQRGYAEYLALSTFTIDKMVGEVNFKLLQPA